MSSSDEEIDQELIRALCLNWNDNEVEQAVVRVQKARARYQQRLEEVKNAFPEMSGEDQALVASLEPEGSVVLSDGSIYEYTTYSSSPHGRMGSWLSHLRFREPFHS